MTVVLMIRENRIFLIKQLKVHFVIFVLFVQNAYPTLNLFYISVIAVRHFLKRGI